MFTVDEIEARIRRQPFVPVRLVTRSGQWYDITQSNHVLIGNHALIIGIPWPKDPRLIDGDRRVAVTEITAIQDVPLTTSAETKG
jgi:hypothetical protein